MSEKRSFYNVGEAKGFKRRNFYEAVIDLANGTEMEEDILDLIAGAANYELESLDLKSKSTGEKKDPLDSPYAIEIKEAFIPLLTKTPQTLVELEAKAAAKGLISKTKEKPFATTWISRVLSNTAGVDKTKVIVETVNAKGLKAQVEKVAYFKN